MCINKILIIGGYGSFGKRLAEQLCANEALTITLAGRSIQKAQALIEKLLPISKATLIAAELDVEEENFEKKLTDLHPDLVLDAGGNIHDSRYLVANACIDSGAHYIDLSDDRRHVCDITSLDEKAKNKGVLVISGASATPGLSSMVVDHFKSHFSHIDIIDTAIAPGNKVERGNSCVRGVLSCTGKSFMVLRNGFWQTAYGWMEPRQVEFGDGVGKRWLANINNPDLELFPEWYAVKKNVYVQASLELLFLHLTMVGMALAAKWSLIRNWSNLARPVIKTSHLFKSFGTDKGAMQVVVKGLSTEGKTVRVKWLLQAFNGIGTYIPTLAALIVTEKLISGELTCSGARPCRGLFQYNDFGEHAENLGLRVESDLKIL